MFTPEQWAELVKIQEELVHLHKVELDLSKEATAAKALVCEFEAERLKDLRAGEFGIPAEGVLVLQRVQDAVASTREKQQIIAQRIQQVTRDFCRLAAQGQVKTG